MTDQLDILKAKRSNILLIFAFSMLFLLAGYLLAGSLLTRFETSLGEFQPMAKNFNAALGEAGVGVKELSKSGGDVLTRLSNEIPAQIEKEYINTGNQISKEYLSAKQQMQVDYANLKIELTSFKNKVNEDISWLKIEIEQWRQLILIISAIFGIVLTLISIQDIISNIRWLLTFFGFFKEKMEKKSIVKAKK